MRSNNIIQVLQEREQNGVCKRRSICRSIIESNYREYKTCWSGHNERALQYDGNLYISNYKYWFQGCYCNGVPHFMKTNMPKPTNETNSKWRIKDMVRYQSPVTDLHDENKLVDGCYRECLYALTSDSYIIKYLVHKETWNLSKKVFLSNKYKFDRLYYDKEFERIVTRSKRFPTRNVDIVFYIGIFLVAPLRFGKLTDAYVTCGLLVLSLNSSFRFYDLDKVIEAYCVRDFAIGDYLNTTDTLDIFNIPNVNGEIGVPPCGLPVNIKVTSAPMPCYEIDGGRWKNLNGLSFGGYPWACLINENKSTSFFVRDVSSGKKIASWWGGSDNEASIDDRRAFFHADNSGRVLTVAHDKITFLKIGSEIYNGKNEMTTLFEITFTPTLSSLEEYPKCSRYGRSVKTVNYIETEYLHSEIIHSIDYDECLDILTVIYTNVIKLPNVVNRYMIGFYDNKDGRLIREMFLQEPVSENDDHIWSVFFSDLLVVCVLRYVANKTRTTVFMYNLSCVS